VIDAARDPERLVVDEVDLEATDARIGAGARDLGLEVLFELECARSFPRGGVALGGN
jgi:hypothetical protein